MFVPTGALMTSSSRTIQPWQLALSELPRPAGLPPQHDVVATAMGVGIEALRAQPTAVGPILCCPLHRFLLIPVPAGTAKVWQAPHSRCLPGWRWDCAELLGSGPARCGSRFWLFDSLWAQAAVTNAGDLYESLSRTRSRLRTPLPRCSGHVVREVSGV
ncbi:hypothetical protein ABZZ36_41330 [Actinacidiphila glaucinigra]|uniref:hypothetical protein n=1 Tax=Actinacidiphila glaucinigra TaxID=235986 RepID=UPI0033AEB126